MPDRSVRFLPQFFDELDSQLPDQRSADGAPSAADFLLYDLPSIRDLLASDFERYTLAVPEAGPVRAFIGAGNLVSSVAIYAYLDDEDTVAVVAIDIYLAAD